MQLSQKGCFLLQVLIPIFNCECKDLQGGTLCGPVFCIILKRVLIKKTTLLNNIKLLIW